MLRLRPLLAGSASVLAVLILLGAALQLIAQTWMAFLMSEITFNGQHPFPSDPASFFGEIYIEIFIFTLSAVQLAALAFHRKTDIHQKARKLAPIVIVMMVLLIAQVAGSTQNNDLYLLMASLYLLQASVFFGIQMHWLKSNAQTRKAFLQSVDLSLAHPWVAAFLVPVLIIVFFILYVHLLQFFSSWLVELGIHTNNKKVFFAIGSVPSAVLTSCLFSMVLPWLYRKYAGLVQCLCVVGVVLFLMLVGFDLIYMGVSAAVLTAGFVFWTKYGFGRRKAFSRGANELA